MVKSKKTTKVFVVSPPKAKKNANKQKMVRVRSGPNTADAMFNVNRNLFKHPTGSIPNLRFRGGSSKSRVKSRDALPNVLAAYVDPFDEGSQGVRYPDSFRGLSDTYSCVTIGSLSTPLAAPGASFTDLNMAPVTPTPGTLLCAFTPDPSIAVINGVAGTGGPTPFVWPNGTLFADTEPNAFGPSSGVIGTDISVGNIFNLRSAYNACRLVAGGIKFSSTLNFTGVSGTFHIAPVYIGTAKFASNNSQAGNLITPATSTLYNSWTFNLPGNVSDMACLPGYEQYALSALESNEIVSIFKRVSEEALLFKPTQTPWNLAYDTSKANTVAADTKTRQGDQDNPNGYGHYCICVYIDGLTASNLTSAFPAATSVVEFEVKSHYECQINTFSATNLFNSGTIGYGLSTPDIHSAAPNQPLLMAAVDNMSSDIPAIRMVDAAGVEEEGFIDAVIRYWKSAVSIATSVKGAIDVVAPILGALVL